MQERVGIGAVTDGEYRRASWRDAPFEHLDGFTQERTEADFTFRLFDVHHSQGRAGAERDRQGETANTDDRRHVLVAAIDDQALPKANLPTPSVTHFFRGKTAIDSKLYPDVRALMADVAAAYREEVADLASRGCTICRWTRCRLR